MALTRKMLKAMGIDEEKIEQIIEAHTETVDALKADAEKNSDAAKKLDGVQKELDDAKKDLEEFKKDSYKVKYDAIKEEFEGYKKDIKNKETHSAKEKVARELLKKAGISEKRIDSVIKVTSVDEIELDENGNAKDEGKLIEGYKTEWADFVVTTDTKGADPAKPPTNNSGAIKTREEIYKMENGRYVLSASERQAELEKIYKAEKGE